MVNNLDILLDNDCLTPAQERAIRKLIYYDLFLDGTNNLQLHYYVKSNPSEGSIYYFDSAHHGLKIIKEDVYKHVMFSLIVSKGLVIDDLNLKKEIDLLVFKEFTNHLSIIPLETECQVLFDLWKRVESSNEVLAG